jgi:hypothetical protein
LQWRDIFGPYFMGLSADFLHRSFRGHFTHKVHLIFNCGRGLSVISLLYPCLIGLVKEKLKKSFVYMAFDHFMFI